MRRRVVGQAAAHSRGARCGYSAWRRVDVAFDCQLRKTLPLPAADCIFL